MKLPTLFISRAGAIRAGAVAVYLRKCVSFSVTPVRRKDDFGFVVTMVDGRGFGFAAL